MSSYNHAQLVTTQLYLGSLIAANDEKWLRENNITHIVSLITPQKTFSGISYLSFDDIDDYQEQNIVSIFNPCFSFINEGIYGGGNVLVHCYAGISRSSTIVIGYLMYQFGMSLNDSLNRVKSKRPIVFPNYGFILQLRIFDELSYQERKLWVSLK